MKKLIVGFLALFALGSTVTAQTLPPNTVVGRLGIGPGPAQAIPFAVLTSNLFGSLCTIGGSIPVFNATTNVWQCIGSGTGTPGFIFDTTNPFNVPGIEIAVGTNAAPITTPGPTVRISRTENFSNTLCDSIQGNNECNAGLAVYSKTLSGAGMQANAIYAGATSDASTHDVLGTFSIGRVTGTATGIGTGAYFEGRRDTTTGKALGVEIRSSNVTGSPGVYNAAGISDTSGFWVTAGDSQPSAVAVALGTAPQPWLNGFAATSGSVTGTTFRDDSSSATSIQINGTHATAQIAGTGFSVNSAGAGSFTNVAVTGSTTPTIGMNASVANALSFYTRGLESMRVDSQVTPANFLVITAATAGGSPAFSAAGSDTNIAFAFSTKGTGNFAFATGGFTATQVVINHTASANRQVTLTGANGANPAIGTSGGALALSPNNGHVRATGTTPTLSAGCNGAGSSVSGNDMHGTVTGQTAAATTCTLTFAAAYAAAPDCVTTGLTSPLTGAVTPATGTLVVNFASTPTYKWSYVCFGT
jgi:hypothetical protein